ncbi:MAG: flagellar protein FlgN [Spongiibacteraceae bacterium]|jgi:flagella synthesis protein FlgN|nr:flagellar protein FlgN [Spongiibacteraceae bacterium]
MNARSLLDAMIKAARSDVATCEQIEALLAEQLPALIRRDADQLTSISQQLEPLLTRIRTNARQRAEQLQTLGLNPDQSGMTQLLQRLPATLATRLRPLWQQLEEALRRCRQLNERNGRILAGQRETIAQLLGETLHNDYSQAAR